MKANQKKMQFGSAGVGSATHLGCVLLNHAIGVNITHVPYRGSGPAMQDLIAGRIDYMCEVTSTGVPQIAVGLDQGDRAVVADARRRAAGFADRA